MIISIHALREEGDQCAHADSFNLGRFLSTPSARRATLPRVVRTHQRRNFYPRPPRGGRLLRSNNYSLTKDFYPRPPRGGRPPAFCGLGSALVFLSTPSARRATYTIVNVLLFVLISIHALREEGDCLWPCQTPASAISIHALREEGDLKTVSQDDIYTRFLSTPSARRATYYFNVPCRILWISIHALREEGDHCR